MGSAKVVSLSSRPWHASQLCFEVDGILEQMSIHLGDPVAGFDFKTFYAALGATVSGDSSRLLYDSQGILTAPSVAASFLAALRAEPRKATLNKAINQRQNAYYAKYGNAPAISFVTNLCYSSLIPGSKPNRLDNLSNISNQQSDALATAYTGDGRTGVVKQTASVLNAFTRSSGSSQQIGRSDEESIDTPNVKPSTHLAPPSDASWISVENKGPTNEDTRIGTSEEDSASFGSASEFQWIWNTDYGYRIPYLESQAQNERAQISLIDELFTQFMNGLNLPNLVQVFQNELSSIDLDVYRLQLAYLNTILLSPISGTVTGVFKNPGDPVRAGEPVVRVEDNSVVLLVATLIYRAPVQIGSSVTVTTALFDSPGPATTVTGTVVAVRGRREDDQWDLIVKCNNLDGFSKPIFPLGYHFDHDNTTVSIT